MADGDEVIHPQWQAWVAENLCRGAAVEDLVAALTAQDVPTETARRCVRDVSASPAMSLAQAQWRRGRALEVMLALRREHRAWQAGGCSTVVRRPLPPVEEFLERFWMPGVPAVFTDLLTAAPAMSRWSPDDLANRFGDVLVKACIGRTGMADPDAEWDALEQELPLRELVQRILSSKRSNDVYVIAKNDVLRKPELAPLLDELALPAPYFGERLDPSRMALWMGPAGTHTPLHHDGDNAMFCQIVGRKRVRLAVPESVALLDRSRGVYSHWDPGETDLQEGPERLIEVTLTPGEALFIPAGWWHQVDALDASMSVSIRKFAWPNDFSWYKPGSIMRGTIASRSDDDP